MLVNVNQYISVTLYNRSLEMGDLLIIFLCFHHWNSYRNGMLIIDVEIREKNLSAADRMEHRQLFMGDFVANEI